MTNERALQILESLISINGDVIIVGEYTEALEMAIRSLQQEQPSLPSNLDEASKKIVIQLHPCMEYSSVLGDHLTMGELVELVKAGANWQQEQMGEQARKELSKTDITLADLVAFDEGLKLGRRLERQDTLKDAVEVDVADLNGDIYNYCIEEGLTDEDKVKIVNVPIKEDKK